LGNQILFLAGAMGAFFSRLRYVVQTENALMSFKATWMNLFSSLLVGALAGWTGVFLVYDTKTNIFSMTPFPDKTP
jgi:hypothetical protein